MNMSQHDHVSLEVAVSADSCVGLSSGDDGVLHAWNLVEFGVLFSLEGAPQGQGQG